MTFPVTLTRPLTVVDLETTGKNTKTARIVEIAITQLRPDEEPIEWWSIVNPGIAIPPEMVQIHGISDDLVLGKPRFCDLAPKLIRAFRHCDFAGYGIRFDLEVLRAEFRRCAIDTEAGEDQAPPRILDGLRIQQVKEGRALSDAVERFAGRSHAAAHTARADVTGTIDALIGMFAHWPDLPRDMDALHALQFPRPEGAVDALGKLVWRHGEAALAFGKHADRLLRDVPRSYLSYMLREGDLPADTQAMFRDAFERRVYPVKEMSL